MLAAARAPNEPSPGVSKQWPAAHPLVCSTVPCALLLPLASRHILKPFSRTPHCLDTHFHGARQLMAGLVKRCCCWPHLLVHHLNTVGQPLVNLVGSPFPGCC